MPKISLASTPSSPNLKFRNEVHTLNREYFGFYNSLIHLGYWWAIREGPELIGFAGADPINPTTLFMSPMGIIPRYRGMGLQAKAIQARERYARTKGYKMAVTYIELDNYYSMANYFRANYRIIDAWSKKLKDDDYVYLGKTLWI